MVAMITVISLVAFTASLLTLFSGFGLGTILLPIFALFFPLPIAIVATAVVHLLNNLFKLILVGKHAEWKTIALFTIPASIAAIGGVLVLKTLEGLTVLSQFSIGGSIFRITAIKLTIGILIVLFSLFELLPQFRKITFPQKYLPFGGLLSGFFGGLSGLQGALRSAFLIRTGLTKEQYIGTTVVSAVIVDITRLIAYGVVFYSTQFSIIQMKMWTVIGFAALSAFSGALIGKLMIKKVSIDVIEKLVGVMLIVLGVLMIAGIV
jgi:uncharacterized membrane protein YfcA